MIGLRLMQGPQHLADLPSAQHLEAPGPEVQNPGDGIERTAVGNLILSPGGRRSVSSFPKEENESSKRDTAQGVGAGRKPLWVSGHRFPHL